MIYLYWIVKIGMCIYMCVWHGKTTLLNHRKTHPNGLGTFYYFLSKFNIKYTDVYSVPDTCINVLDILKTQRGVAWYIKQLLHKIPEYSLQVHMPALHDSLCIQQQEYLERTTCLGSTFCCSRQLKIEAALPNPTTVNIPILKWFLSVHCCFLVCLLWLSFCCTILLGPPSQQPGNHKHGHTYIYLNIVRINSRLERGMVTSI